MRGDAHHDAVRRARPAVRVVCISLLQKPAIRIDERRNAGIDRAHHPHAQFDRGEHRQREMFPGFGVRTEPGIAGQIHQQVRMQLAQLRG